MMSFFKKMLIVMVVGFGLFIVSKGNAQATTIALTDEGPRYWEVVESVVEIFEGGGIGVDSDGALILGEVHAGYRITYDVFNNSTYTIRGFMVGVSDTVGAGEIGHFSPDGWSSDVATRWDYDNGNRWNDEYGGALAGYNYVYEADVVMGFDGGTTGAPIQPFQGITGEFGFASDYDELASPVVLFATNDSGEPLVLTGESSYTAGTGRNYTSAAPAPEPTTMLLFGLGLLGVSGISRKNR